jgi:GxxExxY protein
VSQNPDSRWAGEDPLTFEIIGGAIEVHKALGPGLLESIYEECLAVELTERGLKVQRQVPVPVVYKGRRLDCAYRADMIVNGLVLVELKAVEKILPVHEAQLLSYLKLMNLKVGLLFNFHTPYLRDSIVRRVL